MTRHLSGAELDFVSGLYSKGLGLMVIRRKLLQRRRGAPTPTVNNLRKTVQGKIYLRNKKETRGRKPKISVKKLKALNAARKALQRQSKGLHEVTLSAIAKKARVRAHKTTVSRALRRLGISWRSPRIKPSRTAEQDQNRLDWAQEREHLPAAWWRDHVDLYIDCKKFAMPLRERQRAAQATLKVRGAFRTRKEGLKKCLAKPCARKHRVFPGAQAWVLGGICQGRVRLWEYIDGRWNAEQACRMYAGPIMRLLKRVKPHKRSWTVVEDNDPAGFRSSRATSLKQSLKLRPLSLPPYSPDLMPLDFSIWQEIEQRTTAAVGSQTVSAKKYRQILRRVALRLPEAVVTKAVLSMKRRTEQIVAAKGGHIPED
jgi:transposase